VARMQRDSHVLRSFPSKKRETALARKGGKPNRKVPRSGREGGWADLAV